MNNLISLLSKKENKNRLFVKGVISLVVLIAFKNGQNNGFQHAKLNRFCQNSVKQQSNLTFHSSFLIFGAIHAEETGVNVGVFKGFKWKEHEAALARKELTEINKIYM